VKPSTVLRPASWLLRHRRPAALILGLALLLVLLAHPGALADDVYGNISPAPQLPPGGWVGRYPVEHYQLDQYFPAISVGFTSGVDASGVVPMIAYFGAQMLWLVTCFLANGVILLFALAFNLNLLTGNGNSASGALAPISQAIHHLYANTFGAPWLIATITLVGCWAMWKALIQRRYTETVSALAVSFIYFILAIGIVTQPEKTIAPASKLSNELSTAILSLTNGGSVGNEEKAKTAASDQLFELLVLNPWTVLEFGGVEHCATVKHGEPRSVAVRPLSSNPAEEARLASQLENGTEIKGEGGKVCINNRNKYATHFLAYPFQSPNRSSEHEALEHGDDEDLPEADPAKRSGTYPLGPADEPAAEAMGKGGQFQRLLLAFVILLGEVGAYLLLGALTLGVILAQILLLALFAFAPVALLVGIFPGRGHEFFRRWLGKLAGYLARKVIYSLILAVLLAVCSALDSATSNLGWLLAFSLQAAFLWTIFLQRNKLTQDLLLGTVGSHAAREDGNRLANLYFASRLARGVPMPGVPSLPRLPHLPWSKSGGGSETPPSETSGGNAPPPPPGGSSGSGGVGETFGGGDATFSPPNSHATPTHGPGSPPPSSREPDPSVPAAQPPSASTAISTGEMSSTIVREALTPSASPPIQAPLAPTSPATAPPPSPLATAGAVPTRAASGRLTRETAIGEKPASYRAAHGSVSQPKPESDGASAMPPAVEDPNPTDEPIARLFNARRQSNAPTDPATPEDELA
jgi:hypothetical protein